MNVLVGIPTLNGHERLSRCLTSIEQCTPIDRYNLRVLVHDDGSRPDDLKLNKDAVSRAVLLRERAGLEMIMSPVRGGIARGWNLLVRHAPADVCVLLNDDIEVVSDWLEVLVESAARNPSIGMVGLSAYTGLTKAQHAAVLPFADHVARPRPDYREARLLSAGGRLLASQGYAFAFRRELFELVGGFDERYVCFYEEVDFGASLRARGFQSVMCDYPTLYHMGGATTSDQRNMDASGELARSRAKFHEKWGHMPDELHLILPTDARPLSGREWQWSSAG